MSNQAKATTKSKLQMVSNHSPSTSSIWQSIAICKERANTMQGTHEILTTQRYVYLEQVYMAYLQMTAANDTMKFVRKLLKEIETNHITARNPLIVLIMATANVDAKRASKWSMPICYAQEKKVPVDAFIDFVTRHGGIEGCAARCAKLKRKQRGEVEARPSRALPKVKYNLKFKKSLQSLTEAHEGRVRIVLHGWKEEDGSVLLEKVREKRVTKTQEDDWEL